LLSLGACRQPIKVDPSGSQFIPREVALERLKEVLPTAESAVDMVGKVTAPAKDILKWTVDENGIGFEVAGKDPVRIEFSEITSTRLDLIGLVYQVRLFTPKQTQPKKDHIHFNWRSQPPARDAIELIEALRRPR